MDFTHSSYNRHSKEYERDVTDPSRIALADAWFKPSLQNHFGDRLGYELGGFFKDRTVVTIGDGRGGLDSVRLQERGATSVLPTDISPHLLEKAKKDGRISDYRVENAERLSFPDNSFDFTFMKETFHHCPRPWLAFYEMLRVCRTGVVLVEPQDQSGTPYDKLRHLRSPDKIPGEYEDVGNFVFRLSLAELIKVAMGVDLPCIAYRYETFAYVAGVEHLPVNAFSTKALRYRAIRIVRQLAAAVGLIRPLILLAIVFKTEPKEAEIAWLETHGWEVRQLQRNPHSSAKS